MREKILSGVPLAAVVALLLVFASPSYRQGRPSLQLGERVPDFSFESAAGGPARLADLRGKVVVLNFWATWCPPCVEEMPSLNRLHEKLAPLGGMVLGVSVDEDRNAYEKFLRDLKITFPNHREPTRGLSSEYGTFMFPETYILDPQGRLARKIIGPQDWNAPEHLDFIRGVLGKPN